MTPTPEMLAAAINAGFAHSDKGEDDFNGYIEEIVKAALSCAPSPWRGMESAPRDGTEILVHREADYGTLIAYWSSAEEEDPEWDGENDFECWFNGQYGWLESDVTPERWMPIIPPEGEEG